MQKIKKAPNRFNADSHHANYGIQNFLSKHGIESVADMDDAINLFLESEKFVKPKTKIQQAIASFIQNRWGKFAKFIREYEKLPIEQSK